MLLYIKALALYIKALDVKVYVDPIEFITFSGRGVNHGQYRCPSVDEHQGRVLHDLYFFHL